jgi:hypothetical protein
MWVCTAQCAAAGLMAGLDLSPTRRRKHYTAADGHDKAIERAAISGLTSVGSGGDQLGSLDAALVCRPGAPDRLASMQFPPMTSSLIKGGAWRGFIYCLASMD